MRTIRYSSILDKTVGEALDRAGVEFVHESEDDVRCRRLDFYLPRYGVRIGVADRLSPEHAVSRLTAADNVVLLQGPLSVGLFCGMLEAIRETAEEEAGRGAP